MELITRYLEMRKQLAKIAELATIGDRLIAARESAKIKQVDAAKYLGLKTQGMLSRYESNSYRPSLDTLKRLAELYRVNVTELIPPSDASHYYLPSKESSLTKPDDSIGNLQYGLVPITLKTNNMAPMFLMGDTVLVDIKSAVRYSGQYVLIKRGSFEFICQAFISHDSKLTGRFLQPNLAPKEIPLDSAEITGIVVELRRRFSVDTVKVDEDPSYAY